MKRSMRILLAIGLLVVAGTFRAVAQSTSEVFAVTISASGAVQEGDESTAVIGKVKVTNTEIINLARGRALDAAVPANEVLALVLPHEDGEIALVVIEPGTSNIWAVVATLLDLDAVETSKSGLAILAMQVEHNGDEANALLGGALFFNLKFTKTGDEGPPTKLSGSVIGSLDVVTDSDEGSVLITKGKITQGALLGTLID